MRESSNPVFRSLPKEQQGGYAQFGTGAAGYGAQAVHADPYVAQQYPDQQQAGVSRPLTIDDVVTRTGITLAVVTAVAAVSYFMVDANQGLLFPLFLIGSLGGLGVLAGPVRAGHREAQHDPRDARDDLDVLRREHVRGLDGGLGQVHDLFGSVAGQEVADLQAGAVGGHGPRVGVDAAAVTTSLVARAGPPFRPRRTRALPCPDPLVGWGA